MIIQYKFAVARLYTNITTVHAISFHNFFRNPIWRYNNAVLLSCEYRVKFTLLLWFIILSLDRMEYDGLVVRGVPI